MRRLRAPRLPERLGGCGRWCATWLALGAVGCGDDGNPAPPPAPCSQPATAGTSSIEVASGGVARRALLVVPPQDAPGPLPLVLAFHGTMTTPEVLLEWSALAEAAVAEGFVLALPEAYLAGSQWNVPGVPLYGGAPVPEGAPSDVELARDLIDTLADRLCLDPARMYATGFSGGGRLTSTLGCELADRLAAIGPVAGLRAPDPCPATRPLPVVSLHGTADEIDPYEGGGQEYWGYGVEEAAARWATHLACGAGPTDEALSDSATLRSWADCREGAALELYILEGTGHTWPGGPMDPATDTVSANEILWEFFTQASRP